MYPLIRRIILIRTPLSLGSFSLTPLKSIRFLSTSSVNKGNHAIAFFQNHGFSKSQISVIVKQLPRFLSAKHEKTLLPKLLFFQSKGLSSHEVAKLITANPYLLTRSLNSHIIPTFNYFQDLLQTEADTTLAIKRFSGLLCCDPQNRIRPNIEILRQFGVPHTNILTVLRGQPRMFSSNSIRFKEGVEVVKDMGFNALHVNFVRAVSVLQSMSKSTWKKKVEVYRKWGWPEEETISAFRRHPGCMMASENKINGVMDYFVNKIGRESSFIARNPTYVTLSLKSRIVPRGSVYQVLLSEGLIKKHAKFRLLFCSTEKCFLNIFIHPYEKHIPGLLKVYEKKLQVSEAKEV